MAKRKQEIQKSRVVLIVAKLTANGFEYSHRNFKAVEKAKSYWLDGGKRRVSKEKLLIPYTLQKNDLNIKVEIKYQIWCFGGEENIAKNIVTDRIGKEYSRLKISFDRLHAGIVSYCFNIAKSCK